jgi:cytoskeletal protein RodZ
VKDRSEIGDRLREARMRQGLEISACADATRIRERYLVAIEDGRYESLPDPAYVNGFIRAYAAHLGVEVEGPVRVLPVDGEHGSGAVRPRQVELGATRATRASARGITGGQPRRRRWPWVLLLAAATAAIAVWLADVGLPGGLG